MHPASHAAYDILASSALASLGGSLGVKRPAHLLVVAQPLCAPSSSTHFRASAGGFTFVKAATASSKQASAFPSRASARTKGRSVAKQPKSSLCVVPSEARSYTTVFFFRSLEGGAKFQF